MGGFIINGMMISKHAVRADNLSHIAWVVSKLKLFEQFMLATRLRSHIQVRVDTSVLSSDEDLSSFEGAAFSRVYK